MHPYKANVDSLSCRVFEILTFTISHLYHKTEASSKGRLFTRLQRVLKVITALTNTRMQSNTTHYMSNSLLDDSVVKVMPLFDKTLFTVVVLILVR